MLRIGATEGVLRRGTAGSRTSDAYYHVKPAIRGERSATLTLPDYGRVARQSGIKAVCSPKVLTVRPGKKELP